MFLIGDSLHWSASDLTVATSCEYGLLRTLDQKLGWIHTVEVERDPFEAHIAQMGDQHEAKLLDELRATRVVVELDHVARPYTHAALEAARDETLHAFDGEADVVYQATFFDGEFFGYADFVERADDGWLVCDAKLARSAKPRALLQLGAYADQLLASGVSTSSTVALLLGDGKRAEFPANDVLPVFRAQRERLRTLIHGHRDGGAPIQWGDDSIMACGRCEECRQAAEASNDLILVAGLRIEQRRKLRDAGIQTLGDLADPPDKPNGMAQATFDKLQRQASLQWTQMQAAGDAPLAFELTSEAGKTLARLPSPSPGDLFFDFEGDPLYDEGDPEWSGLEYLWGVMDADGDYTAYWAHNRAEEREALVQFLDLVAEVRAAHPDMHVYHYAPYETTALHRLAMRYMTREKELDDLRRSEVFVDLYATVRGSVRVAAPSYSIKKLEPLYMGDELRSDDEDAVADGAASVVAYHEYRAMREADPTGAAARLAALEDYNEYDCLSTLRLRDWLLARAADEGVADQVAPMAKDEQGDELSDKNPVFLELMARSGPEVRADRTADQQAYAMLANALDYHRREDKQFWWEHFERLVRPIDDWAGSRDVFTVEQAEVVQDWAVPDGAARNARRTLRLVGDWTAGSKPSSGAMVIYPVPAPAGAQGPDQAAYAAGGCQSCESDPDDLRVVSLTESRKPNETFPNLPVALAPAPPPSRKILEEAIARVAEDVADAGELPKSASLDVLTRGRPRLRGGGVLPTEGDPAENIVAGLLGMDDSYIAVQGPPGTGKTYTGSRVIRDLVEQHHWRIGVVAQSHAVVENLLAEVVSAGLSDAVVGKSKNSASSPAWSVVPDTVAARAKFLVDHASSGCVLGGTAWTFANENLVEAGGLDLLVIDEAGQFSLAPTIATSVSARRLLLLGDPQQLPQVSQGTHAEPIDESALGWLMDDHDTLPPELGYFLAESYRMHPALCQKVSDHSYEGRLTSAPPARERSLEGVEPGLQMVLLGHVGNRTESIEEAHEVVNQVQSLLGLKWTEQSQAGEPSSRPLGQDGFVVVAPYNAQVALIRRELDHAGLPKVRVGTVDKFQGQQAPIVIVSMTASSHGDVPRGMGFLLSRNRVNVAISRAKWRAIVLRSASITSFMPSTTDGVLELGAFIALGRDHA